MHTNNAGVSDPTGGLCEPGVDDQARRASSRSQRSPFASWVFCGCLGIFSIGCGDQPPIPHQPVSRMQAEGLGKDGDLAVDTMGRVLNRYAALGADANRGATTLTVSSAFGQDLEALQPIVPGDLLLLMQMQGAEIRSENSARFGDILDLGGAGLFELIEVTSVDSQNNRLIVNSGCGGLKNSYLTRGKTQIVRVPLLRNLTVSATGSIVPKPWDGQSGGILALQVAGSFVLNGHLDASSAGFRGGSKTSIPNMRLANVGSFYLSMNAQDGGNRGESIAGDASAYAALGQYGRGAAANGGGGGNRIAAGGGGGGNGGLLASWTGQGLMPDNVTGGASAWPLDPSYAMATASQAGGGRGGYTLSDGLQDPTAVAPGSASWGQDLRRERGGLGGRPVPNDPQAHLFLGGGGGSGDDFMDQSGGGGRGGGIILIDAAQLAGTGMILAHGQRGDSATSTQSGGGGGGAGGSIVLAIPSIQGITVQASGGAGGDQSTNTPQAGGPGGGGGGGFIAAVPGLTLPMQASGGAGGRTRSTDVSAFPRNGASDGATGTISQSISGLFAGAPLCAVADVSIELSAQPSQARRLEPFVLQVRVRNHGPSRTGGVVVPLEFPSGVRLIAFSADGWDCAAGEHVLRCSRSILAVDEQAELSATVTPALAAPTLSFSASVSAPASDPLLDNNRVTLVVPNTDPLDIRFAGGGVGCSLSPTATAPGLGRALLIVALALLPLRRRRRVRARRP